MDFIAKRFSELSLTELYEIMKSRAEVFLLEQNIVCRDLDDVDYHCLHCFLFEKGRVIAYLRACVAEADVVTVGRVLTLTHGKGYGRILMEKSIEEIKKHFTCKRLTLHTQKQAAGFYEKLGFATVSGGFLEEGIVHVTMERELL